MWRVQLLGDSQNTSAPDWNGNGSSKQGKRSVSEEIHAPDPALKKRLNLEFLEFDGQLEAF